MMSGEVRNNIKFFYDMLEQYIDESDRKEKALNDEIKMLRALGQNNTDTYYENNQLKDVVERLTRANKDLNDRLAKSNSKYFDALVENTHLKVENTNLKVENAHLNCKIELGLI